MPLHVQRTYYIVHTLALAKLTCAVLYSTRPSPSPPSSRALYYIVHALALALAKLTCAVLYSMHVAREVAWHLSTTVFLTVVQVPFLFDLPYLVYKNMLKHHFIWTFMGANIIPNSQVLSSSYNYVSVCVSA